MFVEAVSEQERFRYRNFIPLRRAFLAILLVNSREFSVSSCAISSRGSSVGGGESSDRPLNERGIRVGDAPGLAPESPVCPAGFRMRLARSP